MEKFLKGHRILITGASSGIGKGIALAFGRNGAKVLVNYHSDEEAAFEVVNEINQSGGEAIAFKTDVSKPHEISIMFDLMLERFGGLDTLIANAGIQEDALINEMSVDEWKKVIDVNLTGPFLCAQEAIRIFRNKPMEERKSRGSIIFMSSVHQHIPWAGHVNYAASKGGLKLLMESLAQEVAHEKIRVNAIAPGAIKTAINEEEWSDPQNAQELLKLIPYGRIGETEDVAEAAMWLASPLSDYVVGTTLTIDGGMTLYPSSAHGG